MVRFGFVAAFLAAVMTFTGCSWSTGGKTAPKLTPAQISTLCRETGEATALIWVAAATPTPAQIDKVKFVVVCVNDAMLSYQGQGFIGMLPEVDNIINQTIKGTDERAVAERRLAHLLASNVLVGLDDLFMKHPDWETKGAQAAAYVSSFAQGALGGLGNYQVQEKVKAVTATTATALRTPTTTATR